MADMLALDFMQRAFLAALLVGAVAPLVGVFLVQRRLALIGDGMGHVALAGVAVGVLTGSSPVWAALIAALVAAVVVELIRTSGHSQGDVALAIIFYGGIAASVVIISASPKGTPGTLTAYLFGAITTVTQSDLWIFGALTALILVTFALLRWRLFAVASDEEYARSAGLPVLPLNLALAALTAVTVVVSMRIVGLLLISALMIVPNAAAQVLGRSCSPSGAISRPQWARHSLGALVGRHTWRPRSTATSTDPGAGTRRFRTTTMSTMCTTAIAMRRTWGTTTSTIPTTSMQPVKVTREVGDDRGRAAAD